MFFKTFQTQEEYNENKNCPYTHHINRAGYCYHHTNFTVKKAKVRKEEKEGRNMSF